MLQDKYGRLLIVGAFIVISVILIMAPGMNSNKADEEQLNFTSMPKENVSKSQDNMDRQVIPEDNSASKSEKSFASPEEQMLDAWGMNNQPQAESVAPPATEPIKTDNAELPKAESLQSALPPEPANVTEAASSSAPAPAVKKSKYKQIHVNGKCFAPPVKALPMLTTECSAATYTLGIKSCPKGEEKDGWAGAVRNCGGINNMPDMDDLLAIAKILYSNDAINISDAERKQHKAYSPYTAGNIDCDSYERAGITYQESKAQAYGYPLQAGFSVWGKAEINPQYALNLFFDKTLINYSSCSSRFVEDYYAVCKVECE